jgi:hypothetical protein
MRGPRSAAFRIAYVIVKKKKKKKSREQLITKIKSSFASPMFSSVTHPVQAVAFGTAVHHSISF